MMKWILFILLTFIEKLKNLLAHEYIFFYHNRLYENARAK